ncbi:acetylcholinesterase-like [Amblyomma americanum]
MSHGRHRGSKGSHRSSSSPLTAGGHEQQSERTLDSNPLEIHAISTSLTGSHAEDHSRRTATASPGSSTEELCGSQWSSRLKAALQLPHNMRVELLSLMEKDTSAVQRAARDNPVSAQMNSFWSMWAPNSRSLLPRGWRPMTPSDLACAVATILTLGIVVLASFLLFFSTDDPKRAQVTVSGAFGSVTGIGKLTAGRHVYAFLGVPFGEPPLRGARFRKAAPRQPEVFDGRKPGPACFQEGEGGSVRSGVSEDCLHLNIWTPEALCGDASCANRTVLFFLHGGLFQSGSNNDDPLDGRELAKMLEKEHHIQPPALLESGVSAGNLDVASEDMDSYRDKEEVPASMPRRKRQRASSNSVLAETLLKSDAARAKHHEERMASYLSALGDVVVVVPNYRLGALGFLYSGGPEAPGNAGLHDQLLALEWTRAHIGSFAGNGSDVVVMGHGAGAGSVGLHLFGRRLTTRAILMSGSPFARMRDNTVNRRANLEWLAQRVHCGSEEAVASCLRNAEAESLYWPDASLAVPRFSPTFSGLLPDSPFRLRHLVQVVLVHVFVRVSATITERTDAFGSIIVTEESAVALMLCRQG